MRETEGELLTLRWAKALKNVAEKITVYITPNQLIAGRVGKFGRYGILYPEIDGDFYREVLADLEHRDKSPFQISQEDIKVVMEEIAPYWEGKTYHGLVGVRDLAGIRPLPPCESGEGRYALPSIEGRSLKSIMFHPVTSPGHHYLIVTDSRFTNLGNFYGSDYFLSRVGLDQKRQQVVLLGDAFYETRLVQQQILESTGRRFLGGYSTDADQMRGLMPRSLSWVSLRASSAVDSGSRLAVGSSSTRACGRWVHREARPTFCFWPSES